MEELPTSCTQELGGLSTLGLRGTGKGSVPMRRPPVKRCFGRFGCRHAGSVLQGLHREGPFVLAEASSMLIG